MEILIARSGDEIHVSVPFALKDRAKKVNGYRWNPALKVWVFPNTQAIFSALIAEFGDNARVEGFDNAAPQTSSQPPEPTVQDQLNEKIKSQEALLQKYSAELSDLKVELRGKSTALESLERHLASKNRELEKALKQIESLKVAPEEQKLKQSIEFWKRSAADAERKYEALLKETSHKPAPSPPPAATTSVDPFVQIVSRAISIAGRDRDFEVTVNNTTLSRAPLDLATASEKKLRKSLGIPSSDRRDFIAIIREAAEARVISDEARGLLNFVRQNRNRVAHDQLNQSELWARSCIAILATSIVWPELHGAET